MLNPRRTNLGAHELECLGIITCLIENRGIVSPSMKYLLHTDHLSLAYLKNLKYSSNKLFRWSLISNNYNLEIKHKPGILNRDCDCRSRFISENEPVPREEDLPDEITDTIVAGIILKNKENIINNKYNIVDKHTHILRET